jgi:type IV secretory pathway VirB2 component (pilin)
MQIVRRLKARLVFLCTLGLGSLSARAQSSDPLQTLGNNVLNEFHTLAPIIVGIGVIVGAISIIFGHTEGWNKLGKVLIGGALIIGATWVVQSIIGLT